MHIGIVSSKTCRYCSVALMFAQRCKVSDDRLLGGEECLKNFACISGVASYSLTFIAAGELYFKDESHLSFPHTSYSLEKLP
jgi:hypothetical protein